ncbi:MAG: glucose-6-phosphate dehydrogenase, partial [Mesorhizobium sp.]
MPLAAMSKSRRPARDREGTLMNQERSDTLVLFGATGDLAHKKIFPALYTMVA